MAESDPELNPLKKSILNLFALVLGRENVGDLALFRGLSAESN
jgi:hypothetical protein